MLFNGVSSGDTSWFAAAQAQFKARVAALLNLEAWTMRPRRRDAGRSRGSADSAGSPARTRMHCRPSAGRLIDWGRLVTSTVALLAVIADPTRPTVNVSLTYAILALYVSFALLVVLFLPRRRLSDPTHLISAAADILFLGVLAASSEELESPFLAFFTFALISSAIRWGWWGVLGAASSLQILLIVVGIPDIRDADPAVNMLIIRSSSCWIFTLLLGYFGSYRRRSEYRLRELADWPNELVPQKGWPWLATALRHSANVLGTSRIVVVWRDRDSVNAQLASWTGTECHFEARLPKRLSEALLHADRRWSDTQWLIHVRAMWTSGTGLSSCDPLERGDAVYRVPLQSLRYEGCVIVVDPAFADEDTQSLTRIIASRIALELEHFALIRSFADEASSRERADLAQNLHDVVLQDLTAAVLRLDEAMTSLPSDAREPLQGVSDLLRLQQSKIRQYVTEGRSHTGARKCLRDQLEAFAAPLARQWNCRIDVFVEPSDVNVSEQLAVELCLALSEATANALRHGNASVLTVIVAARGKLLQVKLSNDGAPFPSDPPERPRSLQSRVERLGGRITVSHVQGQVSIDIELPLEKA